MEIRKVEAARLNPAAYNPRRKLKPGDKDYEKLKRSIEEFGFVEPVVWNQATGHVVGGHQRLQVLLDMGETEVDCVVVDLDPQREKALNLALNRIQGDWDEEKLAALIGDLDASGFDVSYTGFDAGEIDALMNRFYSAEAVEDGFDEIVRLWTPILDEFKKYGVVFALEVHPCGSSAATGFCAAIRPPVRIWPALWGASGRPARLRPRLLFPARSISSRAWNRGLPVCAKRWSSSAGTRRLSAGIQRICSLPAPSI